MAENAPAKFRKRKEKICHHPDEGGAQAALNTIGHVRNGRISNGGCRINFAAAGASGCQKQIMWQNIASRNFGSNHVLLGGMIPPSSAIAIKSSMLVGN